MTFHGQFRIYWNRGQDFPLVWSVDGGDVSTEQNVREVVVHPDGEDACTGASLLTAKVRMQSDNVNEPRGWLEGTGRVEIFDGIANIYPLAN